MKKLLVMLSLGVLTLGMVGCGSGDGGSSQASQPQTSASPEVSAPAEPAQTPETPESGGGEAAGGHDYAQGWTDEMNTVKTAVTDFLGDNYFPNSPMDPEILESMTGIGPDMYDDYFAEMPMISTNVDMLIVVKPADGQADAVEEALNSYRDAKVSDTMQYPQNLGKIQASKVAKVGNYVVFAQLGGDIMDLLDQGDEAVIVYCQEINDSVIEAIGKTCR